MNLNVADAFDTNKRGANASPFTGVVADNETMGRIRARHVKQDT